MNIRKFSNLLIALVFLLSFSVQNLYINHSNAAVVVTQGSLQLNVINDLVTNQKTSLPVSDVDVKLLDPTLFDPQNSNVVVASGKTNSDGQFTSPEILKGTYKLVLSKSGISQTSTITIRPGSPTSLKVKFLSSKPDIDTKKTGSVKGIILDSQGEVQQNVKVKLKNATSIYETTTNSKGSFQIFASPGKYDLVVVGLDSSGNDYKNVIQKGLIVTAGQAVIIDEVSGETSWGSDDKKQSFTISSRTNLGKSLKIAGTVNGTSTVSFYQKVDSNYFFLASVKPKKDKTGAFSYSAQLNKALSNQSIRVVVSDDAENIYIHDEDVPKIAITWKAASVEQGNPLAISYTDPTNLLHTKLTKITMAYGSENEKELAKTVNTKTPLDYTVAAGKITINPQILTRAGNYKFKFETSGEYDLTDLDVVIKPSTKLAPVVTVSTLTGKTGSSVQFNVTPLAGNRIVIDTTVPSSPVKYLQSSNLSSAAVEYTKTTDYIIENTKTLAFYELNALNQVIKYKTVTVADSIIRIPEVDVKIEEGTVAGNIKLVPTKTVSYSIQYILTNTATATPKIGATPPKLYPLNGEFTKFTKYLTVYGIQNGKVVKFTQYLINPDDTSIQKIIENIKKVTLPNAEKLIKDQYGLVADGAPLKISVDDSTKKGNTLAYVRGLYYSDGKVVDQEMHINKLWFLPPDGPNGGGTYPMYNDRIVAHELVHAVMGRTMNFGNLPGWFKEGSAEFIHGADERVKGDLTTRSQQQLIDLIGNGSTWVQDSAHYSNGYIAVRYIHERIKTNGGTGIKELMLYLNSNPTATLDTALKNISHGKYTNGLTEFVADFKANGVQFMNTKMNLNDTDTGAIGGGNPDSAVPDVVLDPTNPLEGFDEIWINDLLTPT